MASMRLAIVGGGPYCTYAMERLAASVTAQQVPPAGLEVHVFERTGQFGAGQVHSPRQPGTSFLNRIARHISFGADESVEDAGPLLGERVSPSLYDWCRREFERTGDPRFDISADSWPQRRLHGMALREHFSLYVAILRSHPAVTVTLHHQEVTDIEDLSDATDGQDALCVRSTPVGDEQGGAPADTVVDRVLLLTGHPCLDPTRSARTRRWIEAVAGVPEAVFIPSAYPLEERLTPENAGPERIVGCAGTMLTGVDVILHLTEGRGGRFVESEIGGVRYVPSGREPRSIVAFSESGLFAFARPHEAKSGGPKGKRQGVFLSVEAVDRLRANFGGEPIRVGETTIRQLDYTRHLFPLVVAEMAHVYYTTLFGPDFGVHLAALSRTAHRAFLSWTAGVDSPEDSVRALTAPLARGVDEAVAAMESFLLGRQSHATLCALARPWKFGALVRRYVAVVLGENAWERLAKLLEDPTAVAAAIAGMQSPTRHAVLPSGNRFSWERTINPIPPSDWSSADQYRKALLDFMTTDNLWARQGIGLNPAKAAADGVWRGLRPVIVHAVNFGGLHADSHRAFLGTWLRQHNRLAYGPAPDIMARVHALVDHGIVDVSAGPGAAVGIDGDRLAVIGPHTGAVRRIDVLVDARVPAFDASADITPLYPNLLRRGLVRKWHNPHTDGGAGFEPGGLDLTEDFRAIRPDGAADPRIAVLGPAIEGQRFFQGGAMKPGANHHAIRNILVWHRGLRAGTDG